MHAMIWDGAELQIKDPQVLSAAELRRAIAMAREITRRVCNNWFDLSPEEMHAAIDLADTIDEEAQRAEAAVEPVSTRSMVASLWTGFRAFMATTISARTNSPLMFVFVKETWSLRCAVRDQMAGQHRVQRQVLENSTNGASAAAQKELRDAHAAYARRDFVAFSPERLRERAAQKARRHA